MEVEKKGNLLKKRNGEKKRMANVLGQRWGYCNGQTVNRESAIFVQSFTTASDK